MAGDFNKPVNTDAYATLLQFIRENLAELAKGLDASTAANIPSGAIRFNSTTKRWEKWNGSAWSELVAKASASYDIRTTRADDIVVGASTAKGLGQIGPAANSNGVSNANSYLASGLWFVANADATTNWPEAGLGGFLQVVTNSAGAYIRQTFFIHNANRMYSRYSTNSGSTWSAWKHITANADWNAASGADGFIANKPTLGTAAAADILGTVLQASGVPTGAIIEQGSNSNGRYIRFADGTQICWSGASLSYTSTQLGSLHFSPDITWTCPAAFIYTPYVFGLPSWGSHLLASAGTEPETPSQAKFQIASPTAVNGSTRAYRVCALGRWF